MIGGLFDQTHEAEAIAGCIVVRVVSLSMCRCCPIPVRMMTASEARLKGVNR